MVEISRRTLFGRAILSGGVLLGAGLGLSRTVHRKVPVPPPPPPATLLAALSAQRSLLSGYDSTAGAPAPALPALRSDVAAHGAALQALLELYPGWRLAPTVAPGQPVPATTAALARASAALSSSLSATALGWPIGEPHADEVVPTLASISAALQTHAQVLGAG
jgi:hypothetical protein